MKNVALLFLCIALITGCATAFTEIDYSDNAPTNLKPVDIDKVNLLKTFPNKGEYLEIATASIVISPGWEDTGYEAVKAKLAKAGCTHVLITAPSKDVIGFSVTSTKVGSTTYYETADTVQNTVSGYGYIITPNKVLKSD